MKYPIFFIGGVFVFVIDLVLVFTNFNSAAHQLNAVIATETIDECFDESMDTWFKEFNAYQEKGISLNEADQIASAKALNNFDRCN